MASFLFDPLVHRQLHCLWAQSNLNDPQRKRLQQPIALGTPLNTCRCRFFLRTSGVLAHGAFSMTQATVFERPFEASPTDIHAQDALLTGVLETQSGAIQLNTAYFHLVA